jgi:hypothetical protein
MVTRLQGNGEEKLEKTIKKMKDQGQGVVVSLVGS